MVTVPWRQFSRVTSTGQFIPQIDGLRFLAIALVLGHHVIAAYLEQTHRLGTQQLPRDWAMIEPRSTLILWVLHLAIGVQLFFVISGFVLALPFARAYRNSTPIPSIRKYFLRRLVRIEPPYVISMVFFFLVIVIPWHQADPKGYFLAYFHAFAPHLFASLFYLHGLIFQDASWINGVAWTLEIEVQFYLLLPLIVRLFRFRRPGLLVLIIVSSLTASNPSLKWTVLSQIQFFLGGILLADLYLDPPSVPADVLAVASGALLIYVMHWNPALAWTEPLLIAAFCLAVLSGGLIGRLFGSPFVTIPGGMCYTIYLYHFGVIHLLMPLSIRIFHPVHALWVDAGVQCLVLAAPILAVSAVLFLFTEKPFMILSSKVAPSARLGNHPGL